VLGQAAGAAAAETKVIKMTAQKYFCGYKKNVLNEKLISYFASLIIEMMEQWNDGIMGFCRN
jgi:hypothetical protein